MSTSFLRFLCPVGLQDIGLDWYTFIARFPQNSAYFSVTFLHHYSHHVCQLALLALFNIMKSYESQHIHNSGSPRRE